MKVIIKFILLWLLVALPAAANAEYSHGYIKRFYTEASGMTYVGFVAQPPGTCDNWTEHMKFDSTTDGGKNMLSVLIAAKLSERRLDLWYSASDAPGTNNTNGCTQSVMAVLTGVGLP
ncbi:hypothetical protein J2X32_003132 [Rheinheimera pacifica]|uniref:hypothetical protein n=1 Tax=Rheinheimera pacifica TaxID=173990 RepID=UPI00285A2F73|nr:hypothetical protein [Rheinheimera pacifica]MDR6984488.1 hypothetical protein [Rheinheimera pacifica]